MSLDSLRTLPVGDPWLTAGLLKDGDPIYLVKWETEWPQPQLLHIQSIKDVEIFGIDGSNYGNFVIEKNEWERRFGISASGLQRGVLASAVPVAIPTAEPNTGAWKLASDVDPTDGKKRTYLYLRSQNDNNAETLTIRCKYGENQEPLWDAFIRWNTFIASGGRVGMQHKFGNGNTSYTNRWNLVTDTRTTFHPSSGTSLFRFVFLEPLRQSNSYSHVVYKRDGEGIVASWDTTGLTAALRPIQEHCPLPDTGAWRMWHENQPNRSWGSGGRIMLIGLSAKTYAPVDSEPSLIIRCLYGGLDYRRAAPHRATPYWEARIYWRYDLRRGSPIQANVRFGSEDSVNATWVADRFGEFTAVPTQYQADLGFAFVPKLQESNRFTASVTVADGTTITASWDTTGLTTVLQPLQEHCPSPNSEPSLASDRDVLVALYNATDGNRWRGTVNWLTDEPIDRWQGVQTDNDGRVTKLDLSHSSLAGPLPPELGNLTHLVELDLSDNFLAGPLPAELGNLTRLKVLSLRNNDLTGPLPAEWGNLTNLKHLYLDGNSLTGPLPAEWGALANLLSLKLDDNNLTGPIPAEWGNLTRLDLLWLSGNGLTGPLPHNLTRLMGLRGLYLSNTALCVPANSAFETWTRGIDQFYGQWGCPAA